ncbi:Isoleucine--tRNA ligase [Buchnera aphidicola (Takecallis arundicolens)]|uniref:isoleucine--tRNA ligase n=1 Tax=Buchnera aphidicola TaxID=9 RepID=UPI003464E5F3
MKLYKNTLNLPKTKFPMKGNLTQKEPEILQKWQKENIYQIIRHNNKGKDIFLLHDGPPYANGNIHIGHAINKILKDIIIKSKTLSGFDTPYTPFWDCHGLPIEHKIEQKIGMLKNTIEKQEFRNLCHKYAAQQVKKQKLDFIRLGIFGNWNQSKLTTDKKLESNVINILSKIIEKKYLYRGSKPVHWCIECQSALAEAEVEYYTKKTTAIIVKFQILYNNNLIKIFTLCNQISKINIIIWTTTPWSLPANRAIAVHPEYKYQLIYCEEQYIIIAKKLVPNVMNTIHIKKWNVIQTIFGKELENIYFKHPFLNFTIPIILSKHVTVDTGTGAVHIAPDHGEDDYFLSQKYNIKLTNIINAQGKYVDKIHPYLNKKNIFQSNDIIIDMIKNNHKLLHSHFIEHAYPHCWRHKKPILYRVTKQWFIKIQDTKLQKKAMEIIQNVQWIPKWGYKKMYNLLQKRPDWCISRQRMWGVPIPLFTHKETGELHPETIPIIKKIQSIIQLKGSEIWWKLDKKSILGKNYKKYKKSTDVLDVWFESGCIHNLNIYNLPVKNTHINMYLEGVDQYRGWFMSSLIISMIVNESPPYQNVLTHGFAIDQSGQKMSKSIGNIITPNEIIKLFGADVLRLWVASTNYSHDIAISKAVLIQISEHYRRIRNTSRFLLGNLYDFNYELDKIKFNHMILLDQWIVKKTQILQNKIIALYQNYKFHKIIKKIIKFCSITLGSFYLDIIKDRQYTTQKNSIARRSCQTAMYYIIQSLVRWITPIVPFTAHEIWQYIPYNNTKETIFIQNWFEYKNQNQENALITHEDWNILFNIKIEINKILERQKKIKKINTSLETIMIIYANKNIYNILKILKKELKFMFLVSKIKIFRYKYAPQDSYTSIEIPKLKISVKKYLGIKCPRCWNFFNEINIHNQDKNICNRCNKNVHQKGENRKFL